MKLQLLSDLHLETEDFEPQPAAGAELLVLAGDIDASWRGFERFAGWPVPVLFVAGNHEFDGRELAEAWPALRERAANLSWTVLERESLVLTDRAGQRVRFVGTVRWSDFDLFGDARRDAASESSRLLHAPDARHSPGAAFDAEGVREEALACRHWLAATLQEPAQGRWDKTVVVTHFAPASAAPTCASARSPVPPVSAMPTTICWSTPTCGCMGICTAGTTIGWRATDGRPTRGLPGPRAGG